MEPNQTRDLRPIFRLISAVVVAGLLLVAGFLALAALSRQEDSAMMIWFWPVAAAVFFLLALTFEKRLSEWVSPKVFLLAAVPVLVLLLSAHILLPYVQAPLTLGSDSTPGDKLDLSGDFLETLDGREVSLSDLQGEVTFINFWATWCAPCRAEMPSMAELYTELKDDGLAMLAITDEDPETIRAYLERNPYPFPIILDRRGHLMRRFRVFALPTTLVVDQSDGVILEHQGGYRWDTPEMMDRFRRFLAE